WYPNEVLASDDRYKVKSAAQLAARSARAFHEMYPIRSSLSEPYRVYRKVGYGPLLDIFFIDMRTYRGDNTANDEAEPTAFLGAAQKAWLKRELAASRAVWKVIAADMPIGMVVKDGDAAFENGANGDGPVRGREFDVAEILSFIKHANVQNTVWLTADVHYTAAHHYSPDRARFQDFEPFWEFVSGPLHAGTFGPNGYDNTFGPEVRFARHPEDGQSNLPPSDGLQFFGKVDISAATQAMTVRLMDAADTELWSVELAPAVA
ncbi:MAG: alkaline phosphatase D family protein, partial [Rhodobacteraceae bacterium]|nr:alkaline phosphatase D family protein [Paracoccaceae bacterium]